MTIDDLVLPVDSPARIGQGWNGSASHHLIENEHGKFDDSYAFDFLLEEGSNVYAVKSGIIIASESRFSDNYDKFEGHPEFDQNIANKAIEETNYILIQHDDGTISWYAHFQHEGIAMAPNGERKLQIGDQIEQSQLIGFSGNVGYSSEPHLHFSLGRADVDGFKWKTTPYSFKNYDGPLEDSEL